MHDFDRSNGISLGGPHGIRLPDGRPVEPPHSLATVEQRFARARAYGPGPNWLAAHGRLVAGAVAGVGILVLTAWCVVAAQLSLPWLFYLPGLFVALVLGIAAGLLRVLARRSRRALADRTERAILHLAARTAVPLTIPDTARALGLSLAEAEAALSDMARAGHVATELDMDTGTLHFRFLTALPAEDHLS